LPREVEHEALNGRLAWAALASQLSALIQYSATLSAVLFGFLHLSIKRRSFSVFPVAWELRRVAHALLSIRQPERHGIMLVDDKTFLRVSEQEFHVVPRVLVVDDEPLVLELTRSHLEELGWQVLTASGAGEALRMLAPDQRIDLLITDVQMPRMNGYELAEHAKRMHRDLKIILASGLETARGLPLLRKPFSREQLAAAIYQATRRS
jgi:CheY-like chemotaxis protein